LSEHDHLPCSLFADAEMLRDLAEHRTAEAHVQRLGVSRPVTHYLDGVGTPGCSSDGTIATTQPVCADQPVFTSQFSRTSGFSGAGGITMGWVGTPGIPLLGGM
jgi:hypothetical protein